MQYLHAVLGQREGITITIRSRILRKDLVLTVVRKDVDPLDRPCRRDRAMRRIGGTFGDFAVKDVDGDFENTVTTLMREPNE